MATKQISPPPVDVRPASGARGEGGFALALVLLALVGMTTMAMAGYLRSNTDYKINQNHRAALRAFNVSDAARSHYMARGKLRSDTTTYNYAQGVADVWAEPLLAVDDSSTLYRLVSSSRHNSPEGGISTRMISSIVIHKAAGISVTAAITAPAGLLKNGTSGDVDGHDHATMGGCPVAVTEDVAGLEVPPGGFSQSGGGNGNGGGGGVPGFDGAPAIDSTKTALQMMTDLGIDWPGLLDGSFAQADYVVSTDGYPNFSTDIASDEWPMIIYDTAGPALGPEQSGRGTLVIPGDVTLNGSFAWDGLILIGGAFTSNGNQTIEGAVIAGLNVLLNQSPGTSEIGNGNWTAHYHSCNVLNALKGVGWPVEEPHTWVEIF